MRTEGPSNGSKVLHFPETPALLRELDDLISRARKLLETRRFVIYIEVKRKKRTSTDAEAPLAALEAVERACEETEALKRALESDRLNGFLLEDARTAKAKLESAIAIAEQYT